MSRDDDDLRLRISNPEAELKQAIERERQLNEVVRYYKGRIDVLIRSGTKEGKVVHVFADGARQSLSANTDRKFQAAKRRFATLCHPNTMKHTGIEKTVREEIFKEFWKELEAIERAP